MRSASVVLLLPKETNKKKYLPGLLILQKYLPLNAHISPLITATASKPVWHSSGGSLLLLMSGPEVVFLLKRIKPVQDPSL